MKVSYNLFVGEGVTPDFESGELDHENKTEFGDKISEMMEGSLVADDAHPIKCRVVAYADDFPTHHLPTMYFSQKEYEELMNTLADWHAALGGKSAEMNATDTAEMKDHGVL